MDVQKTRAVDRSQRHRTDASHPAPQSPGMPVRFEEVIERHQDKITRLAWRLLGWRHSDVDDVVQEVFLSAYKHLDRFRGDCEIETWLYRIALNTCRTWQRKKMIHRKLFQPFTSGHDTAPDEMDTQVSDEEIGSMHKCIQRLPLKYREVIVLHYLEETPIVQIAQLLNITTNNVNVRLTRAKKLLKNFMTEKE